MNIEKDDRPKGLFFIIKKQWMPVQLWQIRKRSASCRCDGGEDLMKQKALFFDIDGTLLSEITNEIPESAKKALKQAKEKGHLLFINTGRTASSIPPELRRMPFDGFLCGCGIWGDFHDEVFYEIHLSEKRREEIIKKAFACNVDMIFEGVEDVYYSTRTSRFDGLENTRRYMADKMGLGLERYVEQGGCEYDKMFVYTDGLSRTQEFLAFVSADMDVIDRGNGNYECMPKGHSKATIIEEVLKRFGMEREDAYVLGTAAMICRCLSMRGMRSPWACMQKFLNHMQNLLQRL